MREVVKISILTAVFAIAMFSCKNDKDDRETIVSVNSVTLTRNNVTVPQGESLTLAVGGTLTLIPKVEPENAVNKQVSWLSSVPAVATVTDGIVFGSTEGTAIITVTTEDGNKTASCIIHVTANIVSVTGVTLSHNNTVLSQGETLPLTVGATLSLVPAVAPDNATNTNVSWNSSNTAAATVSNGIVTGVAAGSTTITVTTQDGNKTAQCIIHVSTDIVPVTGVTLSQTTATLTVGETLSLVPTVAPDNATNTNVSWNSSNTAAATVSNGIVTGVAAGSTTITVTTQDGNKTAQCVVNVAGGSGTVAVTGVTLSQTTATLTTAAMMTLTATVAPENADNKTVSWSSSNTGVATVDNGVVTAVGVGTAIITVTTQDGSKTATCSVTVTGVAVTGVTLNKTSITLLKAGDTEKLTASVLPATATNKTVSWGSSNAGVATVSADGTVTATGTGTATITATTQEGSKTAACSVTVTGVAQIRFQYSFSNTYQSEWTMRAGSTYYSYNPNSTTYASWSIVNNGTSAYYEVPAVSIWLEISSSYPGFSGGWTGVYSAMKLEAGHKYTWKRVLNGSVVSDSFTDDGTF